MVDNIVLEYQFIMQLYIYIFAYIVFVICCKTFIQPIRYQDTLIHVASLLVIFLLSYFFSIRDYRIGVDTYTYYSYFEDISFGNALSKRSDVLFYLYMYIISLFTEYGGFLFITAVLYMLLPYIAARRLFKNNAYLLLILFLISPYFFLFGINGIRNGIAGSLFTYGILVSSDRKRGLLFTLLGSLFHKSFFLFFFFYWLVSYRVRPLKFIYIIPVSIFVAYFATNLINVAFSFFGIESYFDFSDQNSYSNFLTYGLPILILGWKTCGYNNQNDDYNRLFNLTILGTAIQLMTIQMEFAVRFAYLAGIWIPVIPLFYMGNKLRSNKYSLIIIFCLLSLFFIKAFKLFRYL